MMISFKKLKNNFKKYIELYKSLYKDKRTPLISKILLWLAIGYAVLPFDLIPDFIPIIGHIDDAIIIPGFIFFALKFIPKSLYREHSDRIFKNDRC